MKSYIAFFLILSMLLSLAACGLPPKPTEDSTSSLTEAFTPSESATGATEPEPMLPQTPLISVSLPVITESSTTDDGTVLFNYTFQNISLVTPDADVADLVIIDFLNRIDTTRTAAESIHAMALAAYKGQPSWTPYLCMISYAPKRIDSGVLSLFGTQASYYGSPHPETVYSALNYDLVTGTALTLGDILSEGDFIDILLQYTLEALAAQKESSYLYSGYEQTVASLFSGNSLQNSWFFSPEGLCFYFVPYEIAPYASGVITAEIPYEKLPGILKDAFFPSERDIAAGEVSVSLFKTADLEIYSRFSELVLTPDSDKLLLHTDETIHNLVIETGNWSSTGSFFTAQHSVFAASSLSNGDAVMIETKLSHTPALRLQYDTDDQHKSMYIVLGTDGTPLLVAE